MSAWKPSLRIPFIDSLQTGDLFAIERNSGIFTTSLLRVSGQGGSSVGGGGSLSGGLVLTGNAIQFAIGTYNFLSGQNDSTFISFGGNFPVPPLLVASLNNSSGEPILAFHFSGINTSGFYTNLTDTVTGNNYYLNYIATTGSGFMMLGTQPTDYYIDARTASYNVQTGDSKKVFTNQFSNLVGQSFNLPWANPGLTYTFIVQSTTAGIKVAPTLTNRIFIADNQTSVGGFIYSSGMGSSISLVAIDTGSWYSMSSVGGWSLA